MDFFIVLIFAITLILFGFIFYFILLKKNKRIQKINSLNSDLEIEIRRNNLLKKKELVLKKQQEENRLKMNQLSILIVNFQKNLLKQNLENEN